MVFVNDRVSFQTEGNQRVILVHGVVHSHYSREDRLAEAYALVSLYESGYADQNDLARSFGYSTRTLRRFQERLHSRGLNALVRPLGRPADGSIPQTGGGRRTHVYSGCPTRCCRSRTDRRSAPYHAGPTQFAPSIPSSRGSLPGPEPNPHAVSGNSTRDPLRDRGVPSKPKKRTGFRGTMSGGLKLCRRVGLVAVQ